ncbi:MAG: VWA domain-containing protein [Rhodocyclaceae bacterium]|nr:VWA domain-containing protein [Rhodocyclaceae bacterium]
MMTRAACPDPAGFDPTAIEQSLAPLDHLPRALWLQALINSRSDVLPRLGDLVRLREEILAGCPLSGTPDQWPLPPATAPFLRELDRLRLPEMARHNEDVADQVVQIWLWHADRIVDYLEREEEPAACERAATLFAAEWQEMAADIEALMAVFETLGDCLKSTQCAMTRGLLRSEGWQELVRISVLMHRLPELRSVIRHLGRAVETDEIDETRPPELSVMERTRTRSLAWREVHVPSLVAETRGVIRGGNIARMLPSESVLMRQPRLRLTWFARMIEQSLLVYEDEDRLREPVWIETESWQPSPNPKPRRKLEAGPMILCVDTSGSMQGGAENVAKAVVLEAMKTASAQKRRCYLFAFGGPEEVLERELPVDARGIEAMVGFLAQGFRAGTDIEQPLDRALARLHEAEWRFADLLVASDGEFGATPAMASRVREAKADLGLRVQGVLIGDRETIGMREICDHVFWVRDWRKFGGVPTESPLQTSGLTAQFFPGALRN